MRQKYCASWLIKVTTIIGPDDVPQDRTPTLMLRLLRINLLTNSMQFSKSFGYALRGILYIAKMQDEKRKIQIDEIAGNLSVPKHFLGKIMMQTAKEGLLKSTRGPYGGFSLANETLDMPLIRLVEITDGMDQFKVCVLKLKHCDNTNPCPLHYEMEEIIEKLLTVFTETTIGDLIKHSKKDFIKSLSTN